MQAFTHFAVGAVAGALVHRAAPADTSPRVRAACSAGAALLAALSHVLLDDVAKMTYHPPDPRWGDPFWIGYHALAVVGAVWVAWRFRRYWYALIGSIVPDVDWIIGRPLGLWAPGSTHSAFRELPLLGSISGPLRERVPDLRLQPLASLGELALIGGLLALALWLDRREATAAAEEVRESAKSCDNPAPWTNRPPPPNPPLPKPPLPNPPPPSPRAS